MNIVSVAKVQNIMPNNSLSFALLLVFSFFIHYVRTKKTSKLVVLASSIFETPLHCIDEAP